MENSNLLLAFIIVAAAAIVIQAGILVGMFVVMRRSSTRMEALANEIKGKVLPTVGTVQAMIAEYRPKIGTVVQNVEQTSTMVRGQMSRIDETMNDILDRTRLQVIRADEIISRGMDRVEQTTETVQRAVTTPVKKMSGVVQGVSAGFDYLVSARRRRIRQNSPGEEMFI
jgi:hypothetical protein